MAKQKDFRTLLATFGAVAALAGCSGADEVASPGEGAFPPPAAQTPSPPAPTPSPPVVTGPPADCPAGFTNVGTIARGTTIFRSCQLPQTILGGLLVPRRDGTVYSISGRVDVGGDQGGNANSPRTGVQRGTLTVEAGVTLYGSAGLDYIVVNRGSQLNVQGTATQPVIMTSRQSVEGSTNVDSIGQWGGLVMLGRAPISNCPGTVAPGTPDCEAQVEGTNAFYGGNAPGDSSGSIRYLRIQHSGFQILPNNELNGITLAGVGNGTVFEYVQVHNSSDDGIEWFGGTVNGRYLVMTGNDDDSADTDVGYSGANQFVIVLQRANGGDRMFEMSGSTRTPASQPKFANVTAVGRNNGGAALIFNSGADNRFYNTVVTKPAGGTGAGAACLDVDDATTTGLFRSVYFSCTTAFDDDANGAAATLFGSGTNNNTANGTSTLQNRFVNGANETAVAAFPTLTSASSFFTQVSYIGAVRDANDSWWQGWTCGLASDSTC